MPSATRIIPKEFELLSRERHARNVAYGNDIRRRRCLASVWQEYAGANLSGNVVCDVIGLASCRVRREARLDWKFSAMWHDVVCDLVHFVEPCRLRLLDSCGNRASWRVRQMDPMDSLRRVEVVCGLASLA